MKIKVYDSIQEGTYYYKGFVELGEFAAQLQGISFEPEVLEKAKIHRENMEQCMVPFQMTLRLETGCKVSQEEDALVFECETFEIYDGKSKAAAVCRMKPEILEGSRAKISIFVVSEEKMKKIQENKY